MNFIGTIFLSVILHCLLILSLLIMPAYTRKALPENQIFMVNLVEEKKTVKYVPPEPKKPEKTKEVKPKRQPRKRTTAAKKKETEETKAAEEKPKRGRSKKTQDSENKE